MQTVLAVILAAAAAYLLGSVSFAVVVSKGLYHQDVRQFGSGNAGMTNCFNASGRLSQRCCGSAHRSPDFCGHGCDTL